MQPDERRLLDAWLIASADLDFQLTPSITLSRRDEAPAQFVCLVHGFGSPKGTLISAIDSDRSNSVAAAKSAGFYTSALNPAAYATYEREHFIDTLEDWGWCGEGAPPAWYKGQSPWA